MTDFDFDPVIYCKERDEILRSLDPVRLKEFYCRFNPPSRRPSHDDVYEIMMHKVRYNLETFTPEEKALSQIWLLARGYSTRMEFHWHASNHPR